MGGGWGGGTRETVYSGTVMAVACGTHTFTNTAGRQCPWTSCIYRDQCEFSAYLHGQLAQMAGGRFELAMETRVCALS